ncbi:MAG: 50S ribosomal protein L32 [Firmicutes bacterium HGW-Firmicutes-12]|nr:MAG: 50S ribosomal protein L32 [Firmicutes bacterium HGW-Firmicutes-12]
MGVQQNRRSKARNRRRRAVVMKLESPNFIQCPKCHEYKMPHRVCPECGFYNDTQVIQEKQKAK